MAISENDSRAVEGSRINRLAILQIKQRLDAAGVTFLLLYIPTKEHVYEPLARGRFTDDRHLTALWESERRLKRALQEFCEENGVRFVDSTDALRDAVERRMSPYNDNLEVAIIGADGHPNANGYRAIATAVNEAIARTGVKESNMRTPNESRP